MNSLEIRRDASLGSPPTRWADVEDKAIPKQIPTTYKIVSIPEKNVRKSDYLRVLGHRKNLLALLFGLLWIAPALVLLWLNTTKFVVGAKIGCKSCRLDPTLPDYIGQQKSRDIDNRSRIGALQLAARLLDAWFVIAAASLAYNYAIRLARKGILPVSLLSIHTEFVQLIYLKDLTESTIRLMRDGDAPVVPREYSTAQRKRSSFWKRVQHEGVMSAFRRKSSGSIDLDPNELHANDLINNEVERGEMNQDIHPETSYGGYNQFAAIDHTTTDPQSRPLQTKVNRYRLYWFITSVAGLCILSNLMNPSVAILMLPTLQWMDINKVQTSGFGLLSSHIPPPAYENKTDYPLRGCRPESLTARQYNCTQTLYGYSLDAIVSSIVASSWQTELREGTLLPAVSQEGDVSFSFNISMAADSPGILWAPSRQVLRELSTDLQAFRNATSGGQYDYEIYPDAKRFNESVQARLQRNGPVTGIMNSCSLGTPQTFDLSTDRQIRCYSFGVPPQYSKCIRYGSGFPEYHPDSFTSFALGVAKQTTNHMNVSMLFTPTARYLRAEDSCLVQNQTNCDWERIFSQDQVDDSETPNVRYRSHNQLTTEYAFRLITNATAIIYCDSTALLSFASYVLDLNPVYNSVNLVQVNVPRDPLTDAQPVPLHMDWMRAAWSVPADSVVDNNRSMVRSLFAATGAWTNTGQNAKFVTQHFFTVAQAFTLIPYTRKILSPIADPNLLSSSANIQVWRYNHDTTPAKLALVAVALGMLVVVLRTIFYLEASKTSTELIVDALCHPAIHPDTINDQKSGAPYRVSYIPKSERPSIHHRRKSSGFGFHHPNRSSTSSGT